MGGSNLFSSQNLLSAIHKCSFSHIVTTILVMHALRRQASLFERTIGCHTDGDE